MVGASLLWVGWFGFNAAPTWKPATQPRSRSSTRSSRRLRGDLLDVLRVDLQRQALDARCSLGCHGRIWSRSRRHAVTSGYGRDHHRPAGRGRLPVGRQRLKRMLGADDALDVFGVHCVGGMLGRAAHRRVLSPALGGTGLHSRLGQGRVRRRSTIIGAQVVTQAWAVGVTLVWSAVVAFIAYKIVNMVVGLRVTGRGGTRRARHQPARRNGLPQLIERFPRQVVTGTHWCPFFFGYNRAGDPSKIEICSRRRAGTTAPSASRSEPSDECPESDHRALGPAARSSSAGSWPRPRSSTGCAGKWQEHETPFYCSVDLRNSVFKLAPVDTNLFPGGFNNLSPEFHPLCVQAAMTALEKLCPGCARRGAGAREPHAQPVLSAERRDAPEDPAPGRHDACASAASCPRSRADRDRAAEWRQTQAGAARAQGQSPAWSTDSTPASCC